MVALLWDNDLTVNCTNVFKLKKIYFDGDLPVICMRTWCQNDIKIWSLIKKILHISFGCLWISLNIFKCVCVGKCMYLAINYALPTLSYATMLQCTRKSHFYDMTSMNTYCMRNCLHEKTKILFLGLHYKEWDSVSHTLTGQNMSRIIWLDV